MSSVAPNWMQRVRQASEAPDAARLDKARGTLALACVFAVAFAVPASHSDTAWTAATAVLIGHVLAAAHWNWIGPLLGRGMRRVATVALGGIAAALWALLLVEPMQRLLQSLLLRLTLGTVWEGMVAGTVWSIVPLLAVALALAAQLAWRAGAHAVLEGRIVPRAVHDTAWVATVVGVTMASMVVARQLDPSASMVGVPWWVAAAGNLSLFVEAQAATLLAALGAYAVPQFLLAWRAATPPPACGTLVVLDLRPAPHGGLREARRLMQLATAWTDGRGPIVLVRHSAAAAQSAGMHAYWAHAAGQLETLFVNDALTAHRWAAAWCGHAQPRQDAQGHAAARRPMALRECYTQPRALPELVSAIAAVERDALFLLLVAGSEADDQRHEWVLDMARLSALRDVLPKRRSMVLIAPPADAADSASASRRGIARLGTLQGRIDTRRGLRELVGALEHEFREPPPQWRIALVGRPRTDASADRLVASLDQRKHSNGALIDAMRPLRSGAGGCETAILLFDTAWLAGDPEAMAGAARLAPAVAAARDVYALVEGDATAEEVRRAAASAGWTGSLLYLGPLPRSSDLDIDAAVAQIADRFISGVTVAPANLLVQREPPTQPERSSERPPVPGARATALRPHVASLMDQVARQHAAPGAVRESEARVLESLHAGLIGAGERLDALSGSDDEVRHYEVDVLRPSVQALRLFQRRGHAMVARPVWHGGAATVDASSVVFAGAHRARNIVADACASRGLELCAPRRTGVDPATWLWRSMQRAGLAVIDLSDGDPQACYQLGQACALGTELLLIARHGSAIPFDVPQFVLRFRDGDDLAAQLPDALDATLYGLQTHTPSAPMHGTLQRCRDLAERAFGLERTGALLSRLEATVAQPVDFGAALEQFLGQMGNAQLVVLHPYWSAQYPARDEKRCFVVMPFSHQPATMYRRIAAGLSASDVQVVRGDETLGQGIAASIWEETARASHVLVDLTGYDLTVCFELGMADAIGRDTLLIGAQGTSDRHFPAIDKRRIHLYGDDDESQAAVLSECLAFTQRTTPP